MGTQKMRSLPLFVCMFSFILSYADTATKPSKTYLVRDSDNKTHIVKTKSVAEKGRPTRPKKKKYKRTGLTPEEAFEEEYFPKKQKQTHGDYAAVPQTDDDEDGSQEMTIIIEETQIAGGYAHSGL